MPPSITVAPVPYVREQLHCDKSSLRFAATAPPFRKQDSVVHKATYRPEYDLCLYLWL